MILSMLKGGVILDSIVVKVSDLYEKANELYKDNMEFVELSICEADTCVGELMPPCIIFHATKKDEPFACIDCDGIDMAKEHL